MKSKLTLSVVEEPCDNCGKTPSVNFYRNAKGSERENYYVNLCEECLSRALETFSAYTEKTP